MQRNKAYAVTTLAKVAQDLGEAIELLEDLTDQMDTEDGLIWVYDTDEDPVRALSDDGIECLQGLIAEHRRQEEQPTPRPSTEAYRLSMIYHHSRLTDDRIKQAPQN